MDQISLFDYFSPIPAIGDIVHGYKDMFGRPNIGRAVNSYEIYEMEPCILLQDLSDSHEFKYKVMRFIRPATQEEMGDICDCQMIVNDGKQTKRISFCRNSNSGLYNGWWYPPEKWRREL